jgi:hypothetical protein
MKKSMFYIDRAKQKQSEFTSSDVSILSCALREIVTEWIERDADDACKSVGNCMLWRAQPLLFALLAEEFARREVCPNKKAKFLIQAINCYILAKHLSLARTCAAGFSGLGEITALLLGQAKNTGNQKTSPLYCAVLFELVANIEGGVKAEALCAYQFAGYFYAIVGEYQLAEACIQSWMCNNTISYLTNVAIGFGSDNP